MDDLLSFGEVSESDEDKFLSDPFGQGAIKSKETVVEKKVTEVQGFQGISLGLSDDDGGYSDIGDLFGKKKQVQEKKDDNVVQQVVSERQQTSNVTEVTKPKFDEIETFQESDNLNDSSNLSNLNFNKENDKTVTQSNVTGLTGLTGLSGLQNTEPTVSSTSNVTGLTGLTGLNNLSNLNGPALSSESQSKSQSKTSATENYKFTGLTGLTGLNSGTTSAGLTGLNNLINLNSNLNLGSDSKFSINQNISKESSTNNIKDHSNFTLNFGSNNIQTGTNGVTGTNTSSIMKPPDFKSLMSVQTDTADAGGKGGNGDIQIQNHNDNTVSSNTNSGTSTSVEKFNFNFESSSSVTQPQVTGTDKKDVFNPFGNLNLKIQTQQQPQTNFQDTTVTGANANSNTSNFGTGLTGLTGLNNLSSQSTTMTNSTTGPSTYKPLTGLSLSNLNTNVTNEKNPSSNITDSTIVQPSLSMQLNQNTDVFNPFGNSSILTGGINGSGSKDNATALTTLGGGKNNLNLVGLMNLSTGTTAKTNSIKKADEAGVATAVAAISKESTGLKTDLKNFDISAIINQNQNQNQNSNTSKTSTTLNTVTVKDPFNPFGSSSNNVNVPSSTGPSNMKFDFKEALKMPTNPISTTTVTTAVVEPVVKVEPIKVNEGREEESVADSKVKDDDNRPQAEESEDEKSKTYDFGFDDEDDDDEAAANQDGKSAGVGVGNVDTSSSGNKEVMESLTKFKPANDIATVVEKTKPSSTNILDNLKNSLNMVNLNSNTTSAASAAAATTTSVTNTVTNTESDNDTLGQSILNLPVTVDETQQMTTNTDSLKTDTVTSNFDGDNAPVVTVTVDTESESNVTAKDTATSVNVQPNGPNLLNNVNPLSIVTGPPMSLTPTNPQLNTITNQQSVPVPGQPLQSQIQNQILKQGEHKAQGPGPTSSSASTSQHVHRSKNAEPTSNMLIVESEEDARRAMIEQNKLASAKKSARSQNQNNGIQQGGASPSHKFRSDSTDPVPEQVATMTSQSEAQLYSDEFDAESDGGKFPEVVPSKNSTVSGKDSLNNSKQSNSLSNSVKSQSQSQGKGSNAGGSAKASNINDKAAATKGNSNRPNSGSVTANKSQNGSKESIQNSSKSSSKGSQQGALKQKGPGPNKPNLAAAPQNLQQQQQNLTNSSSTTTTDSNTQLSQSVTVSATGNSASTSNAHPNSVLASAAAAERQHGAFTSGPRQGPQTGGGSSGTRSLTRTGAGAGSNGPPQRPQPKQFSTRGGHHHIQQSHGGTGQVSQQHPSDSTLTQSQSSTNGNTVTSQKESESKLSGLFGQDSATEYKRIAQQALSNGNSNPNQRGRNHIQKNIQQATRRVYSTHQNPNHIPTSANNVGASATVNIESQSLPPTNNHQQTQSTQQSQQQQPVNVHLISKNTNPKQSKAAINALQQGFSQQLQMNTLVPGDPTPNQNNPNTSAPVVKPLMVLSLPMSPAAVQRGYQIIWRKCLSPQARRREIIRNQQTLAQKQLEAQCRAELNSQIKKPRLVNNKLVGDPQANDQQVRELAAKTALETGNVSAMKGYGDIYRSPRGQIQQGQQAQGGGVASGLVVPTGPGDQNLPQMSATMGAQPQGFQQPAIQQSNLSATMGGPVPLNGQNQQIQLQNNNWAGNQNGVPQSQYVTVSQTQNDGTSMNSLSSTMQGPQISVAPLTQAQLAALSPAQLQQLQQQQAQQQQMLLQQQQLQLQMAAQQAQQQQQLLQAQQQQAQQLQQNTTAQSQAQQTQSSQSQSQSQSIPPLNPNSAFAQILILTPRSALARARKRQVQRELQYMAQNPERLKKVEEIRKEKERLKHEKQLNDELIKRRKEEERIKNRQMYEEYISKKHKDQDRIKKQEKESRQKREKDDIQFIQLQKEAYEREKNERLEKVRKNREGGHKKARFPRFNDEITLTQLENGQVALGLSPTSHGMQNNLNRQHLVSPVNPLMGGNGNVIQVPNNGTTITTAAAVVTPPVLPNTSVNNDGGGGVQDQLQGNIDSDQTGLL